MGGQGQPQGCGVGGQDQQDGFAAGQAAVSFAEPGRVGQYLVSAAVVLS